VLPQKFKMMETQAVANTNKITRFEALVERAYSERNAFVGFEGTLESAVMVHFSKMSAQNHIWRRDAFRKLLLLMYAKKCYAVLRNPSYITVLANISAFGNKTVRDIESWIKDSLVAEGQLKSLIRHCFAKFEVPAFMENVFAGESKVHMLWYIQLGRGDSVQQLAAFPVAFTGRMAHEFRQTPNNFSVAQAIRRAQATGFGASEERAEAIAWSSLAENFQHEAFYSTVINFIVNVNEEVAFDVLQHVLEYIEAMRVNNAVFAMKGRTWAALARQSAEWHVAMAKKREAEGRSQWIPAPIANYVVADGDCTIKIIQLLTSEALYEEGAEMSHCVAEYEDACEEGRTAIFSVRKFAEGQAWYETLATVEVFLEDMEIVQAKAMYNEMICETAHAVISEWAHRERLAIAYEYISDADFAVMQAARQAEEHIRQMNECAAAAQQRPAYRQHNVRNNSSNNEFAFIIKIVVIVIKLLFVVSKCTH
jgi:hypothetical protein